MDFVDKICSHIGADAVGFFILIALGIVVFLFYKAHQLGKLDWTDLVTAKGTKIVSLTKFLQLVGGITGTWIMIYQTMHDKLEYDLLLVYLIYVGSIDGWSKFVSAKYSLPIPQQQIQQEPEKKVE